MAVVPPAEAREQERVAHDARSAQERFERVRRANLPRKSGRGSTSRCDANIGRFCYWYDSTETDAEPEPARIIDARLALLAVLDSAAARAPADSWIAGQRVRYYIEADRLVEALAVATSCRSEPWWCASLAGVAHHVSQNYAVADSAFAVALRGMPPDQRCEWLDISLIADARWKRALRDPSCARRAAAANRAFMLGQPLWRFAGNDLRTEHFTRHTMALIYQGSANAHGISFGRDSRELLLRYSWPEWYTRHELSVSAFPSFAVTGHDREPTYYFFPDVPSLDNARPHDGSWKLRDTPVPSRYAPRHVERITRLPHQLGRFPRGDSLLIAATFSVADTALARDRSSAVIAVLQADSVHMVAAAFDRFLSGMVPAKAMVVSIEVVGDSTKHAARARYAIEPLSCNTWCLSDVLVIDPTKVERTAGPSDAIRGAYADLRVPVNAAVGVYFELAHMGSGAATSQPASFALTVAPIRVSLARRVAASLRLADRPDAVRMRWNDVLGSVTRESRIIALGIPPSARGRYRLQLSVTPRGGTATTASRDIEIVR